MAGIWRAFTMLVVLFAIIATCYSLESYDDDDDDDYDDLPKKKKPTALLANSKEASMGNFVRLVAMRMVFGLAYMVGLGDWASGLFNGALAPPGSDYDDYGDYGGDDGDDYGDY